MNKKMMGVIIFCCVVVLLLIFGGKKEVFQGYAMSEYSLGSGKSVYISDKGTLRINAILEGVAVKEPYIQFDNVVVTNVKTGDPVLEESVSSELLLAEDGFTSLKNSDDRFPGASWRLEGNNPLKIAMNNFVDYKIEGQIVVFSSGSEVSREDFKLFLMREYKTRRNSFISLHPEFYPVPLGESRMYINDTDKFIVIEDVQYMKSQDDYVHRIWHGTLVERDGRLVFDEMDDEREAFYFKTENEKYEWVDGQYKRLWELKRYDIDPSPYPYEFMYKD